MAQDAYLLSSTRSYTRSFTKTLASPLAITISLETLMVVKGKGTQKHKWNLSESIWKTAHFDANCMNIGFLFLKILRFYVFKMAANGGRHLEMDNKCENYKTQFISQKHAYK